MCAEWWTSWGNWLVRNKKKSLDQDHGVHVCCMHVLPCVCKCTSQCVFAAVKARGPHWVSSLSLSTLIFWDRVSHQIWTSCSESPWCTPFSTPLPVLGWQVDRCVPPLPAFTWTSKNQPQGLMLAQQTLHPPEPPSCSCSGPWEWLAIQHLTMMSNTNTKPAPVSGLFCFSLPSPHIVDAYMKCPIIGLGLISMPVIFTLLTLKKIIVMKNTVTRGSLEKGLLL